MIIVIVSDFFSNQSNGTAMSASNLAGELVRKGHTVRVVAPHIDSSKSGYFALQTRHIPLVSYLAKKQRTYFAKPERAILREAFADADIIHFFLPFKLEIVGVKIAREMGIPCITGFHLQPQNLTYNAHLSWIPGIHSFIFWFFKRRYYRHFHHIHCPSNLIRDELVRHHYDAKLFVISNGFTPRIKCDRREKIDDFFHIAMTGRHSFEKRQDVLIEAVKLSKYEPKIKLYINGQGPRTEHYRALCESLTNPARVGFVSDDELVQIYSHTDLYVHTSQVDGESISTLEAISNGIVPLISDSKYSATKQFALDSRCLFKANDARDLARKIDYFIENRAELADLSARYKNLAKRYDLSACVDEMIKTYEEVIGDSSLGAKES